MTRKLLIRTALACCVLGGAAALQADEPAGPDPRDAEIAALRAQVRRQAEEIQTLRARAERYDLARRLNLIPPATQPSPNVLSVPGERVPPTWIPREFNGMTYYLVPLSGAGEKVPTTAPARLR